MTHPAYRPLGVGCVCAGRMEGDPQAARERERTFRKRETRRRTFMNRIWRRSRDGNEYLRVRGTRAGAVSHQGERLDILF